MNQKIYLRAHTVGPEKKNSWHPDGPKWSKKILVLDTETTIDTRQELILGVYQLCELIDEKYICTEEGLFYNDTATKHQRKILDRYVAENFAQIEKRTFPPNLHLKLYSRADFVKRVFWRAIKQHRMIVGFNLPFDLARIAIGWGKSDQGGWSLILSEHRSRRSGNMEPNPYRPRVCISAKDSKSAFISLSKPRKPKEWPRSSRFLDVHSLAFSLFSESLSLKTLCKKLDTTNKLDHEPSGKITSEEIDYCRGDVRATVEALNGLKREFDLHPIDLHPDQAYSPASIAKAYLQKMEILPPKAQFNVPDYILGIAMQSYYGGRAECRIRRTEVPVVQTDFKSEYPTVNALLGNWDVLTAESVAFEDATDEVRELLESLTLEALFKPSTWTKLSFFALVSPNRDILPVRAVYNGQTRNIGVNELSSAKPIWFAGPDVVASILLAGKVPRIEKALRMVPHGKQAGLKPTSLRGMVEIDPRREDFFRSVIEQRDRNKSNKTLQYFLKILANAGSYGLFVEVTQEKKYSPVTLKVYSGEESFEDGSTTVENQGTWYFPPIASLITAGGRLLLAMLEGSVSDKGGSYLFCDTDSLCIVASEHGGFVSCDTPDGSPLKVLSWSQVDEIAARFQLLSPYNPAIVRDLLKIEDVNFDSAGNQRQLYGYAISAKRYALYERNGAELNIVNPKAHGLGYLYPPVQRKEGEPDWTFDAWNWLLRVELGLPAQPPKWLNYTAVMKIALSTPQILKTIQGQLRPYSFVFCPLVDGVVGYPAGIDPEHFTLITPFTKHAKTLANAVCVNVYDGKRYQLASRQTSKFDKVLPQTMRYILRIYLLHPESKSLAPDGTPCVAETRGLLKRASIVADSHSFVGKETNRSWERGEFISLRNFKPREFQQARKTVGADDALIEQIAGLGLKEVSRRTGVDRNIIRKIVRGKPIKATTLARVTSSLN